MIVCFPFLFGLLNELLRLPWAIRYLLDVAWLILLLCQVESRRRSDRKTLNVTSFWIILFLIYTLVCYLFRFQSPFYYLWGVRNNFRFYAAFFAFVAFLTPDGIESYLSLFDKLFWLNAGVSLYQFFFLQLHGDHLGGLFSTVAGGNGYTNIFFLIVTSVSVVRYLEKQETIRACLAKCGAMLVIAAMAEMKFFFLEFILAVAMAVLFTDFSWRKAAVILGATVGVISCAALLMEIFPGWAGWFSWESILETATSDKGYTSSGDLNRLGAISRINELWLQNGWQRVFGLGLGNCDTAGYDIVNTPFFEKYGDMHYTWLSYAMIYLETGWIGLIFYFGFFVLVYWRICRIQKRSSGKLSTYCIISKIMAILCIVLSIYNSSLRTEAGYMAYFVLAIPFALRKGKQYSGGKIS